MNRGALIAFALLLAAPLSSPLRAAEGDAELTTASFFGPQAESNRPVIQSLMFSKTDISNLIKVMKARNYFGSLDPAGSDVLDFQDDQEVAILEEIRRRAIREEEERQAETTLPDFYVSTIIYRSGEDWSVWLRKFLFKPKVGSSPTNDVLSLPDDEPIAVSTSSEVIRLSSSKPEGDYGRMKVVGVTKDTVTIVYRPDAAVAASNRYRDIELPTPRLKAFNNRVVNQPILYDNEENQFTIMLKTNQTFSINMMRVLEGKTVTNVASKPSASPLPSQPSGQAGASPNGNAPSEQVNVRGDSPEAKIANKLIGDIMKIQQFLPVRPTDKPDEPQ